MYTYHDTGAWKINKYMAFECMHLNIAVSVIAFVGGYYYPSLY